MKKRVEEENKSEKDPSRLQVKTTKISIYHRASAALT